MKKKSLTLPRSAPRFVPIEKHSTSEKAKVIPATSGSKTLKDATNEAIRGWINSPHDTHYIIGSVVGPHPYPDMVARFQSIISEEMRWQLKEKINKCIKW